MFYYVSVIVCAVFVLAESKHIKGLQIKNAGHERLKVEMTDEEAFFLPPGQLASIVVEDHWSGYIRAHPATCKSELCNSTSTVAVFKFQGEENHDKYYVSITEGFNVPIKIQPTTLNHSCKSAVCATNVNEHCPTTHQVKTDEGLVIGCKLIPELFQKLCPLAISSEGDVSNTFSCRSNTYLILIG